MPLASEPGSVLAKFFPGAISLVLIAIAACPHLPIHLAAGASQDFGTCNNLPQGWTCGNGNGLSGSGANIANGVLETDLNATNTGDSNNYLYATSQRGTFPWSPCQAPASNILSNNITTVSSTFTALVLPTTGRYHIYIALYYWLPNGPVTAGGATYQCLDTQSRVENIAGTFSPVGSNATYDPGDSFGWNNVTVSNISTGTRYSLTANVTDYCRHDLKAWGINTATPCQLAGVEIGVEGYQFDKLKVQWDTVSINSAQQPTKPTSPTTLFPILYYILIGLFAAAIASILVLRLRRRVSRNRKDKRSNPRQGTEHSQAQP